MTYELKDTGARRDFDTGARRDQATGKGRYDLIPTLFLRRLAELLERGANKYGDRNWEKGMPLKVFLDSAFRHLVAVMEGKEDEDHPAQAAWNIMAFMQTLEWCRNGERSPELTNDTPYAQTIVPTIRAPWTVEELRAAVEAENSRSRIVPMSGGKPLASRSGGSALKETYQDLENYPHRVPPKGAWPPPVRTIEDYPITPALLDEIKAGDAAREKGHDVYTTAPTVASGTVPPVSYRYTRQPDDFDTGPF